MRLHNVFAMIALFAATTFAFTSEAKTHHRAFRQQANDYIRISKDHPHWQCLSNAAGMTCVGRAGKVFQFPKLTPEHLKGGLVRRDKNRLDKVLVRTVATADDQFGAYLNNNKKELNVIAAPAPTVPVVVPAAMEDAPVAGDASEALN